MAVPANTFLTANDKSIREDLSNVIEMVSPTDYPFMSAIRKGKADRNFTEWQTQALSGVTVNAKIEGDDATNVAITPVVRLANYSQISDKTFQVSGSDQEAKKAGYSNTLARLTTLKSLELKNDMEAALCSAANGVAGAVSNATTGATHSGSPRLLRGLEGWLADNVNLGVGGVAPIYDNVASWSAPVDGTARTLTESMFLDVTQKCYNSGGTPSLVLMSPAQRVIFDTFTGNSTKFNDLNTDARLNASFRVYSNSFGTFKLGLSRFIRNKVIAVLDPSKWELAYYRPYAVNELAKTGDSDRRQLIVEYTLRCFAPNNNGAIKDLQ